MEYRRPSSIAKYSQQIKDAFLASLTLAVCAWLVTTWACGWLRCQEWVYGAAVIGAILYVIGAMGLEYRRKALRSIRGRLPFRPVSGLPTFALQLPSIFSDKPKTVEMRDEPDRGWQVLFTDSESLIKIKVYKRELYSWLIDCYVRQNKSTGNKSAISQRSNRNLDKLQLKARIELLRWAGAIYSSSDSPNSIQYLKQWEDKGPVASAWYIVDELLEEVEESRKLW